MALIVFEGLDRSGKTTQVLHIVDALKRMKIPVAQFCFPKRENTEVGLKIQEFLAGGLALSPKEAYEVFVKQRRDAKSEMELFLKKGTVIIVDRFTSSGIAYGAASCLHYQYCEAMEQGLLKPDMTIFLDMPLHAIMKRDGFGRERYETLDYQWTVAQSYRYIQDETWIIIDAKKTELQVSLEVECHVFRLLTKMKLLQSIV